MNETDMSSEDGHKYNDHFKSLIIEDYLTIERKGLEPKVIKDYAGFMVLSNYNSLLGIKIGDRHIVCFDVSSGCKDNIAYFKQLAQTLKHSDAPNVVMAYLLSLNLSDWSSQEIPSTKMKVDIICKQLPNPIRFIIDYIAFWTEGSVIELSKKALYQKYFEWCGKNGKKPSTNNIFSKKLSEKNIIECKRVSSRKRE